jgi:hypothetical protein
MNTANTAPNIRVKRSLSKAGLQAGSSTTCELAFFQTSNFAQHRANSRLRVDKQRKGGKSRTSWDETFYFDADDRSVLLVNVYQTHRVRKDVLVGRLADTIGGVWGKSKDGGLEDTLHTPDGSDLSGITIKFALAAEPREDVSADERQATDAATRATAVNPPSSTPAAIGLLSSAVDTGTNVATEVQTFETAWSVLLQRMELFNRIDSPVYVTGLVCYIGCEPGAHKAEKSGRPDHSLSGHDARRRVNVRS